ncbi:hypothetical protein [Marinobacter sp. S6332]|uniref:hypothetical protein n=1 Tax=Marinobacter sp. S6332 TaxID=2926403 RepID=UPI001FF4DF88|nr:hypothetical protein [Marinobacter sp. S6332]MCK0164145.1 hypothetical protein [Marinobacter sp. S6332]
MLRAIVVLGFILAFISAVVFGGRWLEPADKTLPSADQPVCDLLEGPCEWQTNAGVWKVDLQHLGDGGQGEEYQLSVIAPTVQKRFLAVLRGESMYMGEYPVPMRHEGGDSYSVRFSAPLCTTGGEMVWRIDLQEGQKPLSEVAPIKLVFQARDHSAS